ncbi:protein tramtrack, beta isoform-like [Portunus trituberculatus]|uniref:protein tramtrack, beta isoform-like n=1 Tax=Portunus trituberculatus TaxID=210409 RepID=UPI001E1D13EC|nr:protein tramtrack, beta isoform-like [Portunus trituberculatus]
MCGVCGRVCSNKYTLRTHIEDRHTGTPQLVTCPHCGKEYSSKNSLFSHISRYHRDREPGHVPLPSVHLLDNPQGPSQGYTSPAAPVSRVPPPPSLSDHKLFWSSSFSSEPSSSSSSAGVPSCPLPRLPPP